MLCSESYHLGNVHTGTAADSYHTFHIIASAYLYTLFDKGVMWSDTIR